MNNEEYIEKPEGKPVKKFKARVSLYPNDVVVVNPQEPRESNRKIIKQKGKSSFYKSEGEKESSFSIHINVDANDPDPKSELKMIVKGKLLYETPVLKVYLNKTQKKVVIQTTLDCGPTIERELLQLQGDMGRVIGANYSEIIKVFNTKERKEGARSQETGDSRKDSGFPTTEEIIDRV